MVWVLPDNDPDFSESFDELENEYRPLKSEDEMVRLTDFEN